jgi:hypothetical protein
MGDHTTGMTQGSSAKPIHNLDFVGSPERLPASGESTVEPSHPMQVDGVAGVVLRSLGIFDLDEYQAQLAEAQSSEPPVEKSRSRLSAKSSRSSVRSRRGRSAIRGWRYRRCDRWQTCMAHNSVNIASG